MWHTATWRVICVFCHGDSTRTVFSASTIINLPRSYKHCSCVMRWFHRWLQETPLTISGPLPLHLHMCPSSTQTLTLCEGEKYSRSFLWCRFFSRTQWVKHRWGATGTKASLTHELQEAQAACWIAVSVHSTGVSYLLTESYLPAVVRFNLHKLRVQVHYGSVWR